MVIGGPTHSQSCYTRVSISNCSKGQMRTYKVNQGLHHDADATTTVAES